MTENETVSFVWVIGIAAIVAFICLTIIKVSKTHEQHTCFKETKYELCLKEQND